MGCCLLKPAGQFSTATGHMHLRRRSHHLHPGAAKGLPQQIGHTIGAFRAGQ